MVVRKRAAAALLAIDTMTDHAAAVDARDGEGDALAEARGAFGDFGFGGGGGHWCCGLYAKEKGDVWGEWVESRVLEAGSDGRRESVH